MTHKFKTGDKVKFISSISSNSEFFHDLNGLVIRNIDTVCDGVVYSVREPNGMSWLVRERELELEFNFKIVKENGKEYI
jgi:hypothetical protein